MSGLPRNLAGLLLTSALLGAACGGGEDPELTDVAPATAGTDAADTGAVDGDAAGEATAAPADNPTATPGPSPTAFPTVPAGDNPAFTADSKLTTVGLDTVFFGMTVERAAEAAETEWVGLPDGAAPPCYAIAPAGGPEGVLFTVIDNRIERVDIENPELRTRSGFGLGTTETELAEALGDQLVTTETPTGNRIEFVPTDEGDKDLRLVFETEGGAVVRLRGGRVPFVDPGQPCQ